MCARVAATMVATQVLPVQEFRPRMVERAVCFPVQAQRRLELVVGRGVVCEQGAAARGERSRPCRPVRLREGFEGTVGRSDVLVAPCADAGLNEIG